MIDIREHGGIFGSGGYKPNSYIPSWKLSPFVQDIGGYDRKSAATYNMYRPVIHYDRSTNRIYTGAGKVEMTTKSGVYVGNYSMNLDVIYDIKIVNNIIFVLNNAGVVKLDKELVNSSMIGIGAAKQIVAWKDGKVYAYDVVNKRVYAIDSTTQASQMTYSFIALSATVTNVDTFTRDDNYFYLGSTSGNIYVFTLQGTLTKTISVTGSAALGKMYIRDGYLFTTAQRTLYKINTATGELVWSVSVATTGGVLSGELEFQDGYVYAPSSNNAGNMYVVKESTGETIFKGNVLKLKYASAENQNLHAIHIVDGDAFMTHMIYSDSYGYYFYMILWPTKFKLMR